MANPPAMVSTNLPRLTPQKTSWHAADAFVQEFSSDNYERLTTAVTKSKKLPSLISDALQFSFAQPGSTQDVVNVINICRRDEQGSTVVPARIASELLSFGDPVSTEPHEKEPVYSSIGGFPLDLTWSAAPSDCAFMRDFPVERQQSMLKEVGGDCVVQCYYDQIMNVPMLSVQEGSHACGGENDLTSIMGSVPRKFEFLRFDSAAMLTTVEGPKSGPKKVLNIEVLPAAKRTFYWVDRVLVVPRVPSGETEPTFNTTGSDTVFFLSAKTVSLVRPMKGEIGDVQLVFTEAADSSLPTLSSSSTGDARHPKHVVVRVPTRQISAFPPR